MHPGKIQRFLTEEKLAWLIVVFGIFLRLRQYLFNRSLWFDEAVIAIKLSSYSIPELTRPAATSMAQSVTSPLGFILIEKFFINIFGNNEFSLRLFPFFCGVISLILFKQIIQWLLRKEGRLLALWLFSSIHYLVYYSSEVKHYSSDILVALLLYTLFRQIWMKSLRAYDFLTCGMSGVVALLFSHVAAFILGGGAVALLRDSFQRKEKGRSGQLVMMSALWAIGFLIYYQFSLQYFSQNISLTNYWVNVLGLSADIFSEVVFINFLVFENIKYFLVAKFSYFLIFFFILGAMSLFLRNRCIFGVLLFPILFTLAAHVLKKYFFFGRLICFLVPSFIMIVSEGWGFFKEKMPIARPYLANVLLCFLIINPLYKTATYIVRPIKSEEIRPVMRYIRENFEEGDKIYVYFKAEYAFRYYSSRFGFKEQDYFIGTFSKGNPNGCREDYENFKDAARAWILLSHFSRDEAEELRAFFDSKGSRIKVIQDTGAGAYLYELNG